MKPYQTFFWKSTQEWERKRNKKNNDQSPSTQKSPKEVSHMEVREKLSAKTSTGHMKHVN